MPLAEAGHHQKQIQEDSGTLYPTADVIMADADSQNPVQIFVLISNLAFLRM